MKNKRHKKDKEEIRITHLEGEKICVSVLAKKLSYYGWMLPLLFLVLVAGSCLEFSIWGTIKSVAPNFVLFFILIIVFLFHFGFAHTKRGFKVIERELEKVLEEESKAAGLKVKSKMLHYEYRGTYGEIKEAYYLAYLDNNEFWEYPISVTIGETRIDYECPARHQVAGPWHARFIIIENVEKEAPRAKLSERRKLELLLLGIFAIGGISCFAFGWVITRYPLYVIVFLVSYLLVLLLVEWLSTVTRWSLIQAMKDTAEAPAALFYAFIRLAQPFFVIVGSYSVIAFCSFVLPYAILQLIAKYWWIGLKMETIVFITVAVGSILCTTFYRFSQWIVSHSFLRDWGNHRYQSYSEELAKYLVFPSNIVFLLYLLYLLFLAVSGYLQIQSGASIISPEIDNAVLKAFLVFIAFTNMKIKAKDSELNVSKLFFMTAALFAPDEEMNDGLGRKDED